MWAFQQRLSFGIVVLIITIKQTIQVGCSLAHTIEHLQHRLSDPWMEECNPLYLEPVIMPKQRIKIISQARPYDWRHNNAELRYFQLMHAVCLQFINIHLVK